jgi:4-hydroxy-tetrahydrodipicolinate reductase
MPESAPKRLAIVGYGKMGHLIDQMAERYGFQVVLRVDAPNAGAAPLDGVDVAIEFSTPDSAVANIEWLARRRIPVVVGTTGWYDRLDQVRDIVTRHGSAMVWSPNFSIGVNVFERLVSEAARLLAAEAGYGAWAWEIHHSTKKDAPSGTLLKLVAAMKHAGYARPVDVASNRAGAHPGTHEIGFDSPADTITLRHAARGREGFASGALKAAEWIIGRTGCHEFSEVLFGR